MVPCANGLGRDGQGSLTSCYRAVSIKKGSADARAEFRLLHICTCILSAFHTYTTRLPPRQDGYRFTSTALIFNIVGWEVAPTHCEIHP